MKIRECLFNRLLLFISIFRKIHTRFSNRVFIKKRCIYFLSHINKYKYHCSYGWELTPFSVWKWWIYGRIWVDNRNGICWGWQFRKYFSIPEVKINPIFQKFKVKKISPFFRTHGTDWNVGIFNPIFIYSGYELKRRILINPIFELLKDEKLSPFSSHIGFELTVRFYSRVQHYSLVGFLLCGEENYPHFQQGE